MHASLNRPHASERARAATLFAAALLLLPAFAGCQLFGRPSKERLIEDLNAQLREGKFEEVYDEANDSIHSNVTRERFVQRMKIAVSKLKSIDENLAFQRDSATEKILRDVDAYDDSLVLMVFQTLEKDGKSVSVGYAWTNKGKFFDLWVSPNPGTAAEYEVLGVAGQYYSFGNQVIDW